MKAIVLHQIKEPLTVEDVELEEPTAGEVRVRMVASGVCHSCLHAADGSWGPGLPVPMVLGDEGAGVVEAVGPGVLRLAPGDHVILSWAPACGQCRSCARGRSVICESGLTFGYGITGGVRMHLNGQDLHHYGPAPYASEVLVPERCAVKIRDEMPLEKAALIGCSVMTGVGAVINSAAARPGDSVAVFGCGGIGLNAIQGGRMISAWPLIAVDTLDSKLEMARAFGATHVLNPTRDDVPSEIKRITGRGLNHAVVSVGSTRVAQSAWDSVAPGGTCVMVGLPPVDERITIDPRTLVNPERRLIGASYGSARIFDDFPRMVDLYLAGILRIDELITHRYGMDEANEAFRALAGGENARGVIVF
jgi:S-(hydroxymethyl)glutathione dehydrogenase / alcohol dehydrogenase